MKRISTQLLCCSLFFATVSFSQNVAENFETQAEINTLSSNCWVFNNVTHTTANQFAGSTGSVVSQLGIISEIITPELVIPTNNLQISFSYRKIANNNGSQKLQILLLNGITETKIEEINVGNAAVNYSQTFTGANITGIKKIIFRFSNNISLVFDNLTINAPYANTGGCAVAAITLPIKLLSFQGAVVNSKAQLNWLVDDNHTGDRFEVEKSTDGKAYAVASVVFTTNKQGTESYSYNGTTTIEGGAYYRIKIINKDNSSSYTKVIFLKNAVANTSEEISLVQNPIQSALAFSFTASASSPAKVNLFNMAGVKVYSFGITIQKGTNTIVEPVDNRIANGTYILEVSSTTQRRPVKVTK
jgi:hypothetical protein